MLDDYARWAITAVPPDVLEGRVEEWFTFLLQHLRDEDGEPRSWDDFAGAVQAAPEAGSFDRAVEMLTATVARDPSAWPAIAGQLAQEGSRELEGAYREAWEASALDEGGAPDEEQWWPRLIAEGGDWSGWDGSAEHFEQLRDWFYGVAASLGPDVESLARQHLDWMSDLSQPERIAALEERGFSIGDAARATAAPAEAGEPDDVWARLLDAGGDWSTWDGTSEHWAEMRDWFYSVAALEGDAAAAMARERLEPMQEMPAHETIAAMRENGFTLDLDGSPIQEQAAEVVNEVLADVSIDSIIDGAMASLNESPDVNLDAAVAESLKPLLHERLESVAASQPELFSQRTAAEIDELRVQLQGELETELRSVVQAAS